MLENGFGPGMSGNFLGYDVGGRHNDAGEVQSVVYNRTSYVNNCLLFLSDSDQHILEYGCSYHDEYIWLVTAVCLYI